MIPMQYCARGSPACAAASQYWYARAGSCGTPRPSRYSAPSSYCASRSPPSASFCQSAAARAKSRVRAAACASSARSAEAADASRTQRGRERARRPASAARVPWTTSVSTPASRRNALGRIPPVHTITASAGISSSPAAPRTSTELARISTGFVSSRTRRRPARCAASTSARFAALARANAGPAIDERDLRARLVGDARGGLERAVAAAHHEHRSTAVLLGIDQAVHDVRRRLARDAELRRAAAAADREHDRARARSSRAPSSPRSPPRCARSTRRAPGSARRARCASRLRGRCRAAPPWSCVPARAGRTAAACARRRHHDLAARIVRDRSAE